MWWVLAYLACILTHSCEEQRMNVLFIPAPGNLIIRARLEPRGLIINGQLHSWDTAPAVVEYGEEGGLRELINLTADHSYSLVLSTWVDPTPPPEPDPEAETQAALEAWRNTTVADAWQIIAVLGPARWQTIVDWAKFDFVTTILVEKATTIPRASQTVDAMAYVLDLSPEETDEVFRVAMSIKA